MECDAVETLFDEYYDDDSHTENRLGTRTSIRQGRYNQNVVQAYMPGMGETANSVALPLEVFK
jgi:hypothetical protein